MWTRLELGDGETAERIVRVMHGMDVAYRNLGVDWLWVLLVENKAAVLYYEGQDTEVVLIVYYNPKLSMYRVYTAGYAGALSPEDACDIGLSELKRFMIEQGISVAYAIRRRGLDNPLANRFLDRIPCNPEFHVTVQHEMNDRAAWHMHLDHESLQNNKSNTSAHSSSGDLVMASA